CCGNRGRYPALAGDPARASPPWIASAPAIHPRSNRRDGRRRTSGPDATRSAGPRRDRGRPRRGGLDGGRYGVEPTVAAAGLAVDFHGLAVERWRLAPAPGSSVAGAVLAGIEPRQSLGLCLSRPDRRSTDLHSLVSRHRTARAFGGVCARFPQPNDCRQPRLVRSRPIPQPPADRGHGHRAGQRLDQSAGLQAGTISTIRSGDALIAIVAAPWPPP